MARRLNVRLGPREKTITIEELKKKKENIKCDVEEKAAECMTSTNQQRVLKSEQTVLDLNIKKS